MTSRTTSGLTPGELAATAASIVAMQEPDGAIPWSPGTHADVWNHLEAAMALTVTGQELAARRAFDWVLERQRPDGSWPMKFVDGAIEDHSGETNMSAYLAVALWHHWLVHRDAAFVARCWPTVRRGLDWVVSMQLPVRRHRWAQEWAGRPARTVHRDALLAAVVEVSTRRSGRGHVGRADGRAAARVGARGRPAAARAPRAPGAVPRQVHVLDGLVLPGAGGQRSAAEEADALLRLAGTIRVPGLGSACVSVQPRVTGAETCERVLALEALVLTAGAPCVVRRRAAPPRGRRALLDRSSSIPRRVNWPGEHSTYTAAAAILAADALADVTPGADIMRAARWSGSSSRSPSSAAARQPTGSPAAPRRPA
jgi:hypothetical protein